MMFTRLCAILKTGVPAFAHSIVNVVTPRAFEVMRIFNAARVIARMANRHV
jgi:hypothetical protein